MFDPLRHSRLPQTNAKSARRLFLWRAIGFGIGLGAVPSMLSAESSVSEPTCSVSAGDSLFLYLVLLEQVRSAAYMLTAKNLSQYLAACSEQLDNLYKQLETALEAARRGDLTGQVEKIAKAVEDQRTRSAAAARMQSDWQKTVANIDTRIERIDKGLTQASSEILRANDPVTEIGERNRLNESAGARITAAMQELEKVQVIPENKAKDNFSALLKAVQESRKKELYLAFAAGGDRANDVSPVSVAAPDPFPTSDQFSLTLKDRVWRIVKDDQNFDPGGNLQYWGSMAVCLPIWIAYANEQTTKENLIRGSLVVVRGVKDLAKAAKQLANAYPS